MKSVEKLACGMVGMYFGCGAITATLSAFHPTDTMPAMLASPFAPKGLKFGRVRL
ncbi:hypothetical protein BDZ94DRAFT_1252617 [Collybia nuda]|uniref:Uncharacterized protein n=1 Tax=Collybia nuda TaxID=64659 RepID=A0A9P6CMQ2_9AGAR|nr:hypothetical protein BDZ94DRAFT_1252617 [Collybia nuda]